LLNQSNHAHSWDLSRAVDQAVVFLWHDWVVALPANCTRSRCDGYRLHWGLGFCNRLLLLERTIQMNKDAINTVRTISLSYSSLKHWINHSLTEVGTRCAVSNSIGLNQIGSPIY
jgi:hypothetical protein